MALLTTWSSRNRVISQDLYTTFTREAVAADDSDVFVYRSAGWGVAYYKYTRQRTKQYAYIGMSRATAIRCAAAMNALYSRKVWRHFFNNQQFYWHIAAAGDDIPYSFHGLTHDIVPSGTATPKHDGGDAWSVDISVNEEITIPYRPLVTNNPPEHDELPEPWAAFEANPSARSMNFVGRQRNATEIALGLYDFDYDEFSVGWGSDEDANHDHYHLRTTSNEILDVYIDNSAV